jgi:hypothetical protein
MQTTETTKRQQAEQELRAAQWVLESIVAHANHENLGKHDRVSTDTVFDSARSKGLDTDEIAEALNTLQANHWIHWEGTEIVLRFNPNNDLTIDRILLADLPAIYVAERIEANLKAVLGPQWDIKRQARNGYLTAWSPGIGSQQKMIAVWVDSSIEEQDTIRVSYSLGTLGSTGERPWSDLLTITVVSKWHKGDLSPVERLNKRAKRATQRLIAEYTEWYLDNNDVE